MLVLAAVRGPPRGVSGPAPCSEAMSPAQAAGLLSAPRPARPAEECLKSPARDTQHCYTLSRLNDVYEEHSVILFLFSCFIFRVPFSSFMHEMSYSAQSPSFKCCADGN